MIDVIIRREKSVNNALLALFPAWPGYEPGPDNCLAMGHRQDLHNISTDPRHFMRMTGKTDLGNAAVWEFFKRLWDRYGALRVVEKVTPRHQAERQRRLENSLYGPLEEPKVEILVDGGPPIQAVSVTATGRVIYTTDARTFVGPGQWLWRKFTEIATRGLARNRFGYGHLFWGGNRYSCMRFAEYPLTPDGGAGSISETANGIVAGIVAGAVVDTDRLVLAIDGLGLCTMLSDGVKVQWHKRDLFRWIRGLTAVSHDRVVAHDCDRLFCISVLPSGRRGCRLSVDGLPAGVGVGRRRILFVCSATPADGWGESMRDLYGPPAVLAALSDGVIIQTNPGGGDHFAEVGIGERITSLDNSDDCLWAACGTESGRIVLLRNTCMFNDRALTAQGVILGHIGPVTGLCFSGEHLLSAGEDGTLRRWRWQNFVTPPTSPAAVQAPARDHRLPGKRALILD